MIVASICLSLGACAGTPVQTIACAPILPPPPPPDWTMQAAPEWPTLPGEGRVSITDAAEAVGEAKVKFEWLRSAATALQNHWRAISPKEPK